jgi:hypothetical protein
MGTFNFNKKAPKGLQKCKPFFIAMELKLKPKYKYSLYWHVHFTISQIHPNIPIVSLIQKENTLWEYKLEDGQCHEFKFPNQKPFLRL